MKFIRKVAGFSLMELLISVAVVGILVAIGVPSYRFLTESIRVKGAGEGLYQAIQLARSEAIKRQQDVNVTITKDSSWCYGVNVGTAC